MRVFNVDISRKGISPVVQVTEYDAMSRFFTLVLRNGSADYEPPEGATYSVWYKTKDSHGWYDTITEPDNGTHPAVVADGNAYTIEIAEQATTSCGELALMINGDDGYQLTVSGIITRSDDIPGYDGEEVENYYNVFITRMQENAARAENAADIAVAYGATVEVDEEAQQLNITHHSDTEGGVGWLFGSAVTSEASGSVAAFSDGANDVAVKSLVAEITPVQSGSGDPSPTNIRPISGRTGMTVTRAGKNLLNPSSATSRTVSGVTFTKNADGSITASGTATATIWYDIISNNENAGYFPAGSYILHPTYNSNIDIRVAKVGSSAAIASAKQTAVPFTLTEGAKLYALMVVTNGTTVNQTFYPMVTPSAISDSTYAPYNATEYPITWQTEAGTVYGGTLDVVSGVLTVDRGYFTDDGSANWIRNADGSFYYASGITNPYQTTVERCACNYAPYVFSYNGLSVFLRQSGFISLGKDWGNIYASAADLKAAFAQTPFQMVYPLATPSAVVQLSPTEIKTLLGGNTIYTDAGAVSVEYVADTKKYIDNKVAELQALILEN